MSLKENPRPKLMADLKNLCRNFDKQVHEADMAARAALHYKRGGSMASDRYFIQLFNLGREPKN